MVSAVRYYENLIFLWMVDVVTVLYTYYRLDIEVIEYVVFITSEAFIFHVKERSQIE